MRVIQINGGVFGSTGKIMFGIAEQLEKNGDDCLCLSPVTTTNRYCEPENRYEKIGSFYSRRLSVLMDRITGLSGCFSFFSTLRLLKKIKHYNPDVLHLHNLHNGYINLPLLFNYIKKNNIRVIWTLHDCWAFTGHCPHYTMAKCQRWMTGCSHCSQYREYPECIYDNSAKMYRLKLKWFSGIKNMTIVTPSQWLANQVSKSFLKNYQIQVINNGIDLSIFKQTPSDFRTRWHIPCDKYIILGVAFGWGKKKGLDVFIDLAKKLDSEKYQILLVGTSLEIEKLLPFNIIPIGRTNSFQELAEIYSAADVFVNTTYEDTFPTTNIESLACGTPVLTFDTGGSPEIPDKTCGSVVPCDDVDNLEKELVYICNKKPYSNLSCMKRAEKFDKNKKFGEYLDLYRRISNE